MTPTSAAALGLVVDTVLIGFLLLAGIALIVAGVSKLAHRRRDRAPDGVQLATCAGCTARAVIVQGIAYSAEDGPVPPLCPAHNRKRAHGPWLPVP